MLLHQLGQRLHWASSLATVHRVRFYTDFFQVGVLGAVLSRHHLVLLRALDLGSKNARIRLRVVLEDRLALRQVDRQEAIAVFKRNLRVQCLHGAVLDQLLHVVREVLERLQIHTLCCIS